MLLVDVALGVDIENFNRILLPDIENTVHSIGCSNDGSSLKRINREGRSFLIVVERLTRTERFKKSVLELDKKTREKLKKQLVHLMIEPRNPSLQIKKIKGTRSIFEARVNDFYRFTFEYGANNEIILRVIGPHNFIPRKT
jgi:mRNA interferase RelE/StbE